MSSLPDAADSFADTASKPVVKRLIEEIFPGLKTTGLKPLLLGGDFDTWEAAGAVMKFPRDAASSAKLDLEIALHDQLAQRLGPMVPAVRAVGEPAASFPWRSVAFDRARGRQGQTVDGPIVRPKPWARTSLAKEVAGALSALHTTPAKVAKAAGVPKRDVDLGGVDPSEKAIAWATKIVGNRLDAFLVDPFPAGTPKPGPKVLCHTDIKGEHLYVSEDGTRLTAIVDWADVAISDPALDLAGFAIWLGPTFVHEILEFYTGPSDEGIEERAVYLARANLLTYMDEYLAREGKAGVPVVDAQLRAVFIPPEDPKRRR
ncbi:MAG: aminoglycoside phosphotransferase family protein [Actinomycetota bacterium]